ncbi:hypothetical protein PR048_009066 [Dryococelus australis]|uniref:Uncharacterized protein n=1 Tax=Dryococelus australis TaxID=614101 RepID=A0ABQ9HZ90_9NEOP|nr:hypothetical protein PR048_009066 [Dryococelus australis]
MQSQSIRQEHSQDLQVSVGNKGTNPSRQDYYSTGQEHLAPRVPYSFLHRLKEIGLIGCMRFPAIVTGQRYKVFDPSKLPVPPTNTTDDHTSPQQLREEMTKIENNRLFMAAG